MNHIENSKPEDKKNNWQEYFENTKGNPPRSLLIKAIPFIEEKGEALELGSGALNDSKYLLEQNFRHVQAVDVEPVAQEIASTLPPEQFTYQVTSFENFNFPKNHFDLVNAQYSLPFIHPDSFQKVFEAIKDSLKEKGIFAGQFFGNGDEWANNDKMTFHTLEQAKTLLSDFEILSFEEEDKEKPTAVGTMKHWHVFHFIVRK